MPDSPSDVQVRPPKNREEWERYFDLRWRVLRAPWNQPRGSEQDDREDVSIHVAVWDQSGRALAVGRLQLNSEAEGQVRYMAVDPDLKGRGLGSVVLRELESQAKSKGVRRVILNAREEAEPFYTRHGYQVVGPAETLFGSVPHSRMEKTVE